MEVYPGLILLKEPSVWYIRGWERVAGLSGSISGVDPIKIALRVVYIYTFIYVLYIYIYIYI